MAKSKVFSTFEDFKDFYEKNNSDLKIHRITVEYAVGIMELLEEHTLLEHTLLENYGKFTSEIKLDNLGFSTLGKSGDCESSEIDITKFEKGELASLSSSSQISTANNSDDYPNSLSQLSEEKRMLLKYGKELRKELKGIQDKENYEETMIEALKTYSVEIRKKFESIPIHYKKIPAFVKLLKTENIHFDVEKIPENNNYYFALIYGKEPNAKSRISKVQKFIDDHHLIQIYLSEKNKRKTDLNLITEVALREFIMKDKKLIDELKQNHSLVDYGFTENSENQNCPLNFLVKRNAQGYKAVKNNIDEVITKLNEEVSSIYFASVKGSEPFKKKLEEMAAPHKIKLKSIPPNIADKTKWEYFLLGRSNNYTDLFQNMLNNLPEEIKEMKISFYMNSAKQPKHKVDTPVGMAIEALLKSFRD